MAPNQDENEAVSVSHQGPGPQLERSRKQLGLDLSEVASRLHLTSAVVRALETDDYEQLPRPVFVKGYLRNYARLLGLKEDAVIADYQRLLPEDPEASVSVAPVKRDKAHKTLHSGSGIMRLITWGIVLLLAGMLFFWWQTRSELEDVAPLTSPAESPSDAETAVFPSLPESDTPPETPVAESQPSPAPEFEPIEVIEVIPVEEEALSEEAILAPEPEPAQEPTVAAPQDPPEPVTSPSVTPQPGVAKTLVFRFTAPCWTEVRDRDGKVRMIGEMQPDTVRRLSSEYGPFSVVLGDVEAVTLSIDGTPFNLKSRARGKVARFTLDPSQ
ncbi:MAG: RodZ domain-containing protein [Candidatus Thiodiazotropha sp.]